MNSSQSKTAINSKIPSIKNLPELIAHADKVTGGDSHDHQEIFVAYAAGIEALRTSANQILQKDTLTTVDAFKNELSNILNNHASLAKVAMQTSQLNVFGVHDNLEP